MSRVAELAAALVRIDSVNPALVPGGAGETEIAEFVASWLREAGLEVEVVEPVAGRPSVIGIARGRGGGRSLVLNAHLDTVGVAGMHEPFAARVTGGRLYGRGSYDMKGALAAALVAAADASRLGLAGDVIVTAVADEELGSLGTEAVVERVSADAAIVCEPTELTVAIAQRGFTGFEIETRGVAAHGSRPDLGVDAIALMGPVLVALDGLDRRLQAGRRHPLVGSASLHASLIEGGHELSTYPAHCVLTGERRTLPGESPADVEHELRVAAGDADVRIARLARSVRDRRDARARAGRACRGRLDRTGRSALLDRRGAHGGRGDPDGALRAGRCGRSRGGGMGRPRLARALSRGLRRDRRQLSALDLLTRL